LEQDRYDVNPETEEYGVSSFLYKRDRPFNPHRLHQVLDGNFMLSIINPDEQHDHAHGHGHDEGGEGDDEEMEDEEEDETDEAYEARLAAAKEKFKKDREDGHEKKQKGAFKHLFRSKGFIWLSNRPNLFFEWSQAAVQQHISVGGPWVCTLKGKSLENQALDQDIGDRSQNLIFIGQNMKEMRTQIEEEMDRCLVTEQEWKEILQNKLTQAIEADPFEQTLPQDELANEDH
jgi:G3E family GTPase